MVGKKLLIIEDDIDLREGLRFSFEGDGYEVLDVGTRREGQQEIKKGIYDLVLLDCNLPDGTGFDLCREVRLFSNIPIIMLTAKDGEIDKILGLELGADDYITKPFSVRELVARVKANLRKVEVSSNAKVPEPVNQEKKESKISVGDLELDLDKFEVKVRGEIIDLTLREFEVLKFLASQPEQVVTRETLLEKVWGYEYYGDIRTVDVTVRRIREKIEKDTSSPKILITKRGVGYYIASK